MNRPIILLGGGGDILSLYKYNGGVKVLNLWAKLLRQNGYESYLVTQDGKYDKWLIEHQPVISFETAKKWAKEEKCLKCVITWLPIAKYFLKIVNHVYFYDCEIAYTSRGHLFLLKNLIRSQIKDIATNSHVNQQWYKEVLGYNAKLIKEWSDETYWYPKHQNRQADLIGYMNEPGGHSFRDINEINKICCKKNLKLKFIEISGDEQTVLNKMRQCNIFVGTNPGKHPVYGEGCPRTGNEAMHVGCIVVAYDVKGNREYIKNGETGFLVPRGRPDKIADIIIRLMKKEDSREYIRTNSINFALKKFSSSDRWEVIRNFLGLK